MTLLLLLRSRWARLAGIFVAEATFDDGAVYRAVDVTLGATGAQEWILGEDAGPAELRGADELRLTVVGPKPSGAVKFDVAVTAHPTRRGHVVHMALAGHWDREGWYEVGFSVHWPSGERRSFPSEGPQAVRVHGAG